MSKEEKAAAKEENALVNQNNALAEVPETIDFSADAGGGMEEVDKDTFAIPFVGILQSNSPKCETVEGAKAGKFINSITDELFDELYVIPCAYTRRYIRWAPRATGGGFKGEYMPIDIEAGKVEGCKEYDGTYMFDVPEGATRYDKDQKPLFDVARDTRNHYVLGKSSDGSWFTAILSLSSSMVKRSKRWMSRIYGIEMKDAKGKAFNPPSYSHIYKLTPVREEKGGDKWWSLEASLVGPVTDKHVYDKAKEFNLQVTAGLIKAVPMQDEVTSSKKASNDDDSDLPF
jgi:hypothetical protein